MAENNNGSADFEAAFQRTRAAAKLCMALIEAANADPNTDPQTLWAGVDAIVEQCTKDVKKIWKNRYTVMTPHGRYKGLLKPKAG